MKLRRWIPMLLTLLLVFNLLPTTVLAEGVSTRDYSEYGLASFIEPTNGNYIWMDLNGSSPALTANSEGSTPVMTWADLQAAFNAGGSITLQQGISAGEEDSALTVPSGVEVALDLNGHTIDRRLTSAVASGNVITVNGTLTITDTSNVQTGTITGANNTGSGGAIINKGRLTVSGGTISGNKAQEAGAVLNAAGSVLTISGGTFENNAASTFGGGAIVNHGTVSMSGGLIQNNTAVKNGGGIWSDGTLTVTNGSFANNTAQADGGAVYITGDGSVSEIFGGTITGNTADQSAGAVYMIGGTTTISGGTITGNTAKAHGGALYVAGNSTVLNLFGGTITGNTAANQGGAIVKYQDANTINIQGSPVILNNQAAAGPDIYMRNNSGLLNVTGALSADARIGVTLASGAGTVTFNYGTYNGPDRLACFVPGSSAYAVGTDISQEIVLGSPVTVSFDPGPGTGTMQSVQVANNSYYPLPDCGFTPPHHQEFESWTVNGSSYFPGMYVTISGDTAVKAEYVKHSIYTRVAPVAPTDTVNGSIEYYTCDVCGGYYLYDGSTYTEVSASDIVLPYFTIAANGSEAKIQRYNGSDAEIVIPDTVPDNYPDETLRGRDITAVDQSAFENNTVITKVVMGDNIRLIRSHAFYNASNLKEIVIGSGLYTLESDIFKCPALTSFTCTATQPAESPYYPGLEIPQARVFGDCDISNITFYGMHSGAFHYTVWTVGFALGGGTRNYIGLDAHSDPTWTWAADLSSAEAVFACVNCEYAGTLSATVTSEVTTQPTWTTPGVRTYTASVIVTGVTYTDTRTEEIPVLTYTVTVNGGTADKASAAAGESVTITANAPGTGKRFKEWTGADGLAFTSGSAATATATFTMPANAVTLTATYEDIYSVTVNGGTTDKASAAEGESVTITANEPEYGKRFKEWTGADGLTFTGGSSAASSTATFTMPGRAVTLAATYETSPTTIVTVEFGEGHGDFAAARFGSVEGFTVTGTTLTYSVVLDSTIGDAKEVFSSKADFYPPAVDDGELFTDDLALNPAGYYASLAEVNAERSAWDGQPVPVEGLKFYAQWEKPVGAVTVSVTAPDPGTEVTVSGNEPMRRTDPQVSVSVTGNVTLDTASGANWWTDYDGTYYSGTVASGQACYARFYLNASYGYYLMYYGAQGPVVADGVSVTVENDSEANISIQSSYIRICAKVIAGQHAVSVANGTADKALAIEGESVTITANAPEAGMRFKEWTGADGLTFTSGGPTDAEATFIMPASDVTVSADFITQWTWLQQQLEEDGNTIVLDRDIVCVDQEEGPLTVPEDTYVTLDLNGHTVDRNLTEPTENGNVITVMGWLTLLDSSAGQTGVITGGNNLKDGGGVLVQAEEFSEDDNGSFIMYGGTITGNAARDGGGVSVGYWDLDNMEFFEGYFEMYGGAITGNLAATEEQYYGYGGGVYVSEGQFCLFGGEISENHSDLYGGGVYTVFGMSSAPFVVSGAPVVRDNTWGDVPETDNVAIEHWADSSVIYVEDDGLAPEASIGVNVYTIANFDTMEKIPCLDPFTSGLTNGGDASNFISDFAGYTVILNEDGEAMLAEAAAEPEFKTHALALEGKIGVTFFMDLSGLSDDEKAASYMTFAITGASPLPDDPVPFDANNTNGNGTYYGFTCYVTSIQMADTITATFHYGDDQTVFETYSVKQYINSFDSISSQFDDETVAIVHALADYGHYVQPFLSASHSWTLGPGDDQYAPMDAVYTTEYDVDAIKTAVKDYAFVRENNSADIQKITYSVRLDSDTAILVYFKPVKNYSGSFTVTLDGETYTATKQSDGRYLVEIPNIGAHLLGTTYTIVATTDNGTATVTVSALSYVRSILNSSTYADDATARNAACAIYAYCAAAKAYKDAQ